MIEKVSRQSALKQYKGFSLINNYTPSYISILLLFYSQTWDSVNLLNKVKQFT